MGKDEKGVFEFNDAGNIQRYTTWSEFGNEPRRDKVVPPDPTSRRSSGSYSARNVVQMIAKMAVEAAVETEKAAEIEKPVVATTDEPDVSESECPVADIIRRRK